MTSGIYVIENTETGFRYIGSSYDIRKRWKEHRGHLRRGTHHSRFMQNVWNKHGESVLKFRCLIVCAIKDLLFYEQRLIDAFKPEYNCAKQAGSCFGVKHTAQTIERCKEAFRKHRNAKYDWNGKKVALITVSEQTGFPHKTLVSRVVGKGWSIEKALATPIRETKALYSHDGKQMTLPEWAKELEMHPRRLSYWLSSGMTIADCIGRLNQEEKKISLTQFCRLWGISDATVKSRLQAGESLSIALREPVKRDNSWRHCNG